MGAIGYCWSFLFLILGLDQCPVASFLSYLLTSRLVRCRVHFLSLWFPPFDLFSLTFFLSFFFLMFESRSLMSHGVMSGV